MIVVNSYLLAYFFNLIKVSLEFFVFVIKSLAKAMYSLFFFYTEFNFVQQYIFLTLSRLFTV